MMIVRSFAAPVVLKSHGIGAGKEVTSYPSVKGEFEGTSYKYNESSNVVVDGKSFKEPAKSCILWKI